MCLKDLLTHFYDVFLGGMYHFKQFCPAVVNLFDADRTSWAKYFSPAETNRCSCCGGEDNDLKPFQESLKSTGELSSLEYDALKLGLSSPYSGTTVPLAVMFSQFLRLDLDGTGCSACSSMFQFLYALHFDFEKKLSYYDEDADIEQFLYENDFEENGDVDAEEEFEMANLEAVMKIAEEMNEDMYESDL